MSYLVLHGTELFWAEILEVLVQVLIREVRANEDAIDFAIGTGQLRKSSFLLLLFQSLEQALQGEARGWPAYNALPGKVQ